MTLFISLIQNRNVVIIHYLSNKNHPSFLAISEPLAIASPEFVMPSQPSSERVAVSPHSSRIARSTHSERASMKSS